MKHTVINNNITTAVTIGVDGIYPSLTITTTGRLDAGLSGDGSPGLVAPAGGPSAQIFNYGSIIGGGYGNIASGTNAGGDGVLIAAAAKLFNDGEIFGATGQSTDSSPESGAGGAGVYISPAAKSVGITNTGLIAGGYGGNGSTGGTGGSGMLINTSQIVNVTNSGTIKAGAGGYGGFSMFGMGLGGIGGAGLKITGDRGGLVTNRAGGVILGGKGSFTQLGNATEGTGGGAGLVSYGRVKITNDGNITGGAGGYTAQFGRSIGGAGGTGAMIGLYQSGSISQIGTLLNTGTITGGTGAPSDGAGVAGAGGAGLTLAGLAYNAGIITGGLGASAAYDGSGGNGGNGAALYAHSQMLNTGTIAGGNGGGGGASSNYTYIVGGGTGGNGVVISNHGLFVNAGVINGGSGGVGLTDFAGTGLNGNGGAGVVIGSYGVLINAGTISGGLPGDNSYASAAGRYGAAVTFEGAGILVATPGAVFAGAVNADSAASDVLELAGTSRVALTSFGTKFENFSTIAFAPFASRTIDGNQALLKTDITGFSAGDGIELNFITFSSSDRLRVSQAGTLSVITPGGTYGLAIAGAKVGEMDFSLKQGADGILIGKVGSATRMNFIAPESAPLSSFTGLWSPPHPVASPTTLAASFMTLSPGAGALFEASRHFDMALIPAISLHAGFG
jgi:hypothetical protein